MPDFVAPHFAVPFRFGANGHADCVEQDSHDDVFQCVTAIINTPRGARLDLPDFGIVDPLFDEGGPDTADITAAIEAHEDRASLVVDLSQDTEVDALAWTVQVGVEGVDD
jgi:phage baseplate assembly protein W